MDLSFYALKALAMIGLVWDLKGVPAHVRDAPDVSQVPDKSVPARWLPRPQADDAPA